MRRHLYIYLIALSHQTKYHSKQSSGQRDTKLRKRNYSVWPVAFNPLLNKQNFVRNAFSNNDGQNYLEKKIFPEKSNDKFKKVYLQ